MKKRQVGGLDIFSIIIIVSLTVFLGFYLSYYTLCRWYIRKKKAPHETRFREEELPRVSIIIPVYNEAKVLASKFDSLRKLNYPKDKLEIVYVDGGSTDESVNLIRSYGKDMGFECKVVLQGSRMGFNSAVREGFYQTTGVIILVTGAETLFDSEALSIIVQHFADETIGAVTGRQVISNLDEGFSPKMEVAYRSLYDFVREAESVMDSPFDIKGEISAARRIVYLHLVQNKELFNRGCIDCCISFQAKIDGYRTIYEPNAFYYEISPSSLRESLRQTTRRATTLIQNMIVFKSLILNRIYGLFGLVIMPAHFLMLTLLPLLFALGSIGLIVSILLNPSYISIIAFGLGIFSVAASSRVRAFVKTQLVLIPAVVGLVSMDTQKFKRLESTRSVESPTAALSVKKS